MNNRFTVRGERTVSGISGEVLQKPQLIGELPSIDDASSWLVHLPVWELQFSGSLLCEGLNLWPGGEWHSKTPLLRASVGMELTHVDLRHGVDKEELWHLDIEDRLILIDGNRRVRMLHWGLCGPELIQVEPSEMALYFLHRACAASRKKEVRWALKNLEEIHQAFHKLNLARVLRTVEARCAQLPQ